MLFALLIPLMVLLMYLAWRRSDKGRLRACRWRMDRGAPGEGVLFRCMACGAETRRDDERPPQSCFRTPG
jgi:hypothetical protein